MKTNKEAVLNHPAGLFVNNECADSFQSSRGATEISVRDVEWFQKVFLVGEGEFIKFTNGVPGLAGEN